MRGTLTCVFLVSCEECFDRAKKDRIYKVEIIWYVITLQRY